MVIKCDTISSNFRFRGPNHVQRRTRHSEATCNRKIIALHIPTIVGARGVIRIIAIVKVVAVIAVIGVITVKHNLSIVFNRVTRQKTWNAISMLCNALRDPFGGVRQRHNRSSSYVIRLHTILKFEWHRNLLATVYPQDKLSRHILDRVRRNINKFLLDNLFCGHDIFFLALKLGKLRNKGIKPIKRRYDTCFDSICVDRVANNPVPIIRHDTGKPLHT